MRAQITWTLITELVVMAAGIYVLKLAAELLGAAGFGEYTLSRRATNLLYLPLVMGLGIASPRYVAIAGAGALPGYTARSFVIATLTMGLLPSLVAILLLNISPANSSALIFGTGSMSSLVLPVTIALGGLAIHTMVYSVFRGRGQMERANSLQLVINGIVPVTAFLLAPHSAAAVLKLMGVIWVVVAGGALVAILITTRTDPAGEHGLIEHLRLLLRFGLPRVPGEFALGGIFSLPALIALRTHGVVAAGQFSAGIALLTIVASVFAPVGLVVLPRASAQAATGDLAGLRFLVLRILAGGVVLAAAGVVVGELVLPPLVRWYFGAAFVPAVPIFRACLLGAIPYAVYVLLRNILDALDVRAVNSRNLIISLVCLLISCFVRPEIMWMAFSLVGALTLLSVLSLIETQARLGRRALSRAQTVPV